MFVTPTAATPDVISPRAPRLMTTMKDPTLHAGSSNVDVIGSIAMQRAFQQDPHKIERRRPRVLAMRAHAQAGVEYVDSGRCSERDADLYSRGGQATGFPAGHSI